jgi:cobalt/nickel transport system permease protein
MHMADALLSPVVGGLFWAASAALIGYSSKKITEENDTIKTPLMGALGAFVFAAQMINFTIPGTGSSGHIGGGLLLAALLGPYRAFIALASVLIIQCLFFADGGVLALGCNIFNLAFVPAFIAYPFIFAKITHGTTDPVRLGAGSMTAGVSGLLMGSLAVVVQTLLSGITELPFSTFVLFMGPVHLAIGIVEGLVTWGVLAFVARTEPTLLVPVKTAAHPRFTAALFTMAALFAAGVLSSFASPNPDGLEWAMAKVKGDSVFSTASEPINHMLTAFQQKVAFLPDYGFKSSTETAFVSRFPINAGNSVPGIVGTLSVLVAAGSAGMILGRKRPQQKRS